MHTSCVCVCVCVFLRNVNVGSQNVYSYEFDLICGDLAKVGTYTKSPLWNLSYWLQMGSWGTCQSFRQVPKLTPKLRCVSHFTQFTIWMDFSSCRYTRPCSYIIPLFKKEFRFLTITNKTKWRPGASSNPKDKVSLETF